MSNVDCWKAALMLGNQLRSRMDLSSKSYAPSVTALQNAGLATTFTQPDRQSVTSPSYSNSPSYASSPSYRTTNDTTFPYGLSGVAMPSYGFTGDLYQFTSNGYPRKSRTCSYCGKTFTRSTTRRYHEKRCPLLRAAVCSYIPSGGDEKSKAKVSPSNPLSKPSMVQPPPPGPSPDQLGRRPIITSNSHDYATSHLLTPPPPLDRRDEDPFSYPSVIVKMEPLEGDSPLTGAETHNQGQDLSTLRLTPESAGSPQRQDARTFLVSPFQVGLDLSKSPSNASGNVQNRDVNINSLITSNLMKDNFKSDSGSEVEYASSDFLPEHSLGQNGRENQFGLDPDHRSELAVSEANTSNSSGPLVQNVVDLNSNVPVYKTNTIESDEMNVDQPTEHVTQKQDREIQKVERREKSVGIYRCGFCGKVFDNTRQLHLHEQLHTKFKPYACRFCGQRFAKAALRITHERAHTGENNHVCAVCGSSFTRKYSLRLHMRKRHREGPWLCRHCGKATLTQHELKGHLMSHSLPKCEKESLQYLGDMPLAFGLMNFRSGLNGTSQNDFSDSNDNNTGSPTLDSASLFPTIESMDTQDKETCLECGKDFPKAYMRYHTKAHENQKPYQCPICSKRFGYKNNMKSHIKLHAGIKPYQCNVCGARFTRGSTLRRHAQRHGIVAESVWDLFIKNDYPTPTHNVFQDPNASKNISVGSSTIVPPTSSPDGSSSKMNHKDKAAVPENTYASFFDGSPYSTTQLAQSAMFMGYQNQHVTPHFSPIPTTSPLPGFSSSHSPQAGALNLSVQKPMDHNSDLAHLRQMVEDRSRSRSRSRSVSGSDTKQESFGPSEPAYQDVGVQVKLCCRSEEGFVDSAADMSASMQLGISGATSRLASSLGADDSGETLSSLLLSGKLFRCSHCECFFSEYAMFRIHAKLHVHGAYVCPVCGEDCHDKMYFMLHLSEHLR